MWATIIETVLTILWKVTTAIIGTAVTVCKWAAPKIWHGLTVAVPAIASDTWNILVFLAQVLWAVILWLVHGLVGLAEHADSLKGYINPAEFNKVIRSAAAAGAGVFGLAHAVMSNADTVFVAGYADVMSFIAGILAIFGVGAVQAKRFASHGETPKEAEFPATVRLMPVDLEKHDE